MKMPRITILAMVILWLAIVTIGSAVSSEEDSQTTVVITGILRSRTEYGPPGFGETPKVDSKVRIYILKLHKPCTAKQLFLPEGARRGIENISEIQLRCDSQIFPQCEPILKKSIGKRITVSGETSGQTYPTDYLPVILQVRLITNQ
jgi:hypothetical protein